MGYTKIHVELLKLGIAVAQSTVSVYMVPRRDRPLQTWKTFLRNHMEGIASIDLFVGRRILSKYASLIMRCGWQGRTLYALDRAVRRHYCAAAVKNGPAA